MPRKRTGTVSRVTTGAHAGCWQGLITLNSGRRLRLDPFAPDIDEAEARRLTALASARAQRENWQHYADAPEPITGTADAWVAAWLAERRARGLTSVRSNDQHWRVHIRPVLGELHPRSWTPADLRRLVRELDGKVRNRELSWKTAANVWGTCTRMCDDAHRSKVDELRCRSDNPALKVRGPDRGARAAKQFLYPAEVVPLMACDKVPLLWRRAIAVAVYLYLRPGELRGIEDSGVNLRQRVASIHQQWQPGAKGKPGRLVPTKGRRARRVPIPDTLVPLLEVMLHEQRRPGRLFAGLPHPSRDSLRLRAYLEAAEVTRADLHQSLRGRTRQITLHDLRATGITWCAVRGDAPQLIQRRAGHATLTTTDGYIRVAEAVGHDFGKVFPALPTALLAVESIAESSIESFSNGEISEKLNDVGCRRRELNPSLNGIAEHTSTKTGGYAEPPTPHEADSDRFDPDLNDSGDAGPRLAKCAIGSLEAVVALHDAVALSAAAGADDEPGSRSA